MAKSKRLAAIDWLHVSKYPASAAFTFLEPGVMSLIMASMMFYLVHRPLPEGSAIYGGLRHFADPGSDLPACDR